MFPLNSVWLKEFSILNNISCRGGIRSKLAEDERDRAIAYKRDSVIIS